MSIRWLLGINLFFINVSSLVMADSVMHPSADCDVGNTCSLAGDIHVFPGGVGAGTLTVNKSCYDLALPNRVLVNYQSWDEKHVKISGEAIRRPQLPDAMWYDIKDRRIEGSGCGEVVIYVDTIELMRSKQSK